MAECKINWPYLGRYQPHLEIVIESPSGLIYPQQGSESAIVDTCFDGEILIPGPIYNYLDFQKYEEISDSFQTAGSGALECTKANGTIFIPKINKTYEVEFHLDHKGQRNTRPVLIGNRFLKRFRLILDGPSEKLIICPHK